MNCKCESAKVRECESARNSAGNGNLSHFRTGAGVWRGWGRTFAPGRGSILAAALVLSVAGAEGARAQDTRIRDLTLQDQTVPVRLVGYGLVVGLDGTGDRVTGGRSGGHTVQSVANLLRRFDVEVPAEVLRMRNVAAVLVTAEVSPYLRPGGRFEAHVSSLGDARSLRGGVLWMTPLVSDVGGQAVGTVQGPLLVTEGGAVRTRAGAGAENSARIPGGGVLEADLPRPAFASVSRLLLRQPDLGTATRIVAAINAQIGNGVATVEDPGAVALNLPAGDDRAGQLARIGDLRVTPDRAARVIINGRDGTVVSGGEIAVGEATVSHGIVTLTVGAEGGGAGRGEVRVASGTSVQQVAAALHAVQTRPAEIAAIFEALREVGALAAEVTIR
jgi:flagellar P-ring protein FlgI